MASPETMRKVRLFSGMMILFGVLSLVIGTVLFANRVRFVANANVAKGTVVELVESDQAGDGFAKYAVCVFPDATGEQHRIRSSFMSSPLAYSVGETVKVYYSSSNPTEAALGTFLELWGTSATFGVSAFTFLLAGIVFLMIHKERKGRKAKSRKPN